MVRHGVARIGQPPRGFERRRDPFIRIELRDQLQVLEGQLVFSSRRVGRSQPSVGLCQVGLNAQDLSERFDGLGIVPIVQPMNRFAETGFDLIVEGHRST